MKFRRAKPTRFSVCPFSFGRRTKQIGIRRALGATKPAIVRYFMVENFIVSGVGLAIGGILSVALNMAMVEAFSLEPLAWYVIPAAMIAYDHDTGFGLLRARAPLGGLRGDTGRSLRRAACPAAPCLARRRRTPPRAAAPAPAKP